MDQSTGEAPRYCPARELPPYSYVPGQSPHPLSDPRGHSFGRHEPPVAALDEATWRQNETWLYAIDLFNHGYYWEAHEAWEALWHAAGRKGPTADFLKGLIKLAAAGVKAREGRPPGVRRHALRAVELLSAAPSAICFGIDVAGTMNAAKKIADQAEMLVRSNGRLPIRLTIV